MFFLGIVSWKGASRFNEGVCFLDGEGDAPHGKGIGFDRRVFDNNCRMGGGSAPPSLPHTMGNPSMLLINLE